MLVIGSYSIYPEINSSVIINGNLTVSGTLNVPLFGLPLTIPNGSAGAPALNFQSSTLTGIYRDAGNLGFAIGGTIAGSIIASGFQAPLGGGLSTRSSTSFGFLNGDTGSGSGGEVRVFGSSHASKAGFVEFLSNGLVYTSISNTSATLIHNLTMGGSAIIAGGIRGSGYSYNLISKSSAYSALLTDDIILCNATGGSFTVTPPAGATGKSFTLKKTDSSANYVAWGAQVDGSTFVLATQNESAVLASDGTSWYSAEHNTATPWTAYTPGTTNIGTVASVNFLWRRRGDSLDVMGGLVTGTVAANIAGFGLPFAIDTSKVVPWSYLGKAIRAAQGQATNNLNLWSDGADTGFVFVGATGFAKANGTGTFGTGDTLTISLTGIPIKNWGT